jgi:hypothetical protein
MFYMGSMLQITLIWANMSACTMTHIIDRRQPLSWTSWLPFRAWQQIRTDTNLDTSTLYDSTGIQLHATLLRFAALNSGLLRMYYPSVQRLFLLSFHWFVSNVYMYNYSCNRTSMQFILKLNLHRQKINKIAKGFSKCKKQYNTYARSKNKPKNNPSSMTGWLYRFVVKIFTLNTLF